MPAGRTMGSTSAVFVAPSGHIWVAERCGVNSCAGSDLAPVLEFDATGKVLSSFGAGIFQFPHGIWIEKDGSIWLTDGQGANGKGHQVFKFSPQGKVLMTLGKAGVAGDGPDTFNQPNAVAVAANGDIFVSDGHNAGRGNARVLKFSKGRKVHQAVGRPRLGARASSKCRTRWPSIPGDACSWATAPTIGFRSSTRTANSSTSGSSSDAPAESSSIAMTRCMSPTPNPPIAKATATIRDGSAAFASAARRMAA